MKVMFVLYDTKSGIHMTPFLAHNVLDAQRQVSALLKRCDTVVAEYPADYELRRMGNYYEETGKTDFHPEPDPICNLSELVPPEVKKGGA